MVKDIKGFTQPISKLVELNTQHFDTLMKAQKRQLKITELSLNNVCKQPLKSKTPSP